MTDIFATIGAAILGGGGLVGVAYWIFRVFGEKWLTAKFEQRLAEYKHAQQKEIEELRFRINALMDRTVKLHQREFDVLPEAWSRLNDAHGQAIAFSSALQSYPDLDRMTDDQLEEFLNGTSLQAWEKSELKAEKKRTDYFIKRIFWHRLSDARAACREHHSYLKKNGIFIPADLRAKFYQLDTLIWDALTEAEINESMQVMPRALDNARALQDRGPKLLDELEREVQSRLWTSQLASPSSGNRLRSRSAGGGCCR
jgi:hypothetical protein